MGDIRVVGEEDCALPSTDYTSMTVCILPAWYAWPVGTAYMRSHSEWNRDYETGSKLTGHMDCATLQLRHMQYYTEFDIVVVVVAAVRGEVEDEACLTLCKVNQETEIHEFLEDT